MSTACGKALRTMGVERYLVTNVQQHIGRRATVNARGEFRYPSTPTGTTGVISGATVYSDGTIEYVVQFDVIPGFDWYNDDEVDVDGNA